MIPPRRSGGRREISLSIIYFGRERRRPSCTFNCLARPLNHNLSPVFDYVTVISAFADRGRKSVGVGGRLCSYHTPRRDTVAGRGEERRGHGGSNNFLCVSDFHRPSVRTHSASQSASQSQWHLWEGFFGLIAARCNAQCL